MMLILPPLFAIFYWAFWGFVLGDWSWHVHAFEWPGELGIVARTFHACLFTVGMIWAFVMGVMAHD